MGLSLGLDVFSAITGKSQGELQYNTASGPWLSFTNFGGLLEFEGVFFPHCLLLTVFGAHRNTFFPPAPL
jgi:hypothetical protein